MESSLSQTSGQIPVLVRKVERAGEASWKGQGNTPLWSLISTTGGEKGEKSGERLQGLTQALGHPEVRGGTDKTKATKSLWGRSSLGETRRALIPEYISFRQVLQLSNPCNSMDGIKRCNEGFAIAFVALEEIPCSPTGFYSTQSPPGSASTVPQPRGCPSLPAK